MSNASMTPLLDFFEKMERNRESVFHRASLYVAPRPTALLSHESRIFQYTVVNPNLPIPVFGLTFPDFLRQWLEKRIKEYGLPVIPHISLHSIADVSGIVAPRGILSSNSPVTAPFIIPESISRFLLSPVRILEGREEAESNLWVVIAENLFRIFLERFFQLIRGKRKGGLVPYIVVFYYPNFSFDYDPFDRCPANLPNFRWKDVNFTLLHPLLTEQFPLAFDSPYH